MKWSVDPADGSVMDVLEVCYTLQLAEATDWQHNSSEKAASAVIEEESDARGQRGPQEEDRLLQVPPPLLDLTVTVVS